MAATSTDRVCRHRARRRLAALEERAAHSAGLDLPDVAAGFTRLRARPADT